MTLHDLPALLGLIFYVFIITWPYVPQPYLKNEGQWWRLIGASGGLLLVATHIPNPFLAICLSWFALTPFYTIILSLRGWVRPVEDFGNQVGTQLYILTGAVLYSATIRWWTPDRFWWFLVGLLAVVSANAVFGLFQWAGYIPSWMQVIPSLRMVGFTQTPPFLASLCFIGLLLFPVFWTWFWVPVVPLLAACLYIIPSGRDAGLWATWLALTLWLTALWTPWALLGLIPPIGTFIVYHHVSQVHARLRSLRGILHRLYQTKALGLGLGAIPVLQINPHESNAERTVLHWASPHNDWLHLLLECGPIPVIGLVASLAWYGVYLPVTGIDQAAYLQVLFWAAYALVYFPGHVPFQASLLILTLSYLDSRLFL